MTLEFGVEADELRETLVRIAALRANLGKPQEDICADQKLVDTSGIAIAPPGHKSSGVGSVPGGHPAHVNIRKFTDLRNL